MKNTQVAMKTKTQEKPQQKKQLKNYLPPDESIIQ